MRIIKINRTVSVMTTCTIAVSKDIELRSIERALDYDENLRDLIEELDIKELKVLRDDYSLEDTDEPADNHIEWSSELKAALQEDGVEVPEQIKEL